ncbi:MAG TPA: hypothetical protein VND90_00450 [Terracidiphilus sp.]|nr:hypothetical protein [Terracidiphilus sp.]
MRAGGLEFTGPTLRPLRKWFVSLAILAVCAFFFALGLSRGFPEWLRDLGWAFYLVLMVGGSIWFLYSLKRRRMPFGQLGFIPQSWARWVLDKPESSENARPKR